MSSRLRACLFVLPLLATLLGCAKTRPMHIVLRDADSAYQREDFASAKTDYSEYVTRRPEEVQVRYKLGKTLIATGEPRAAIEHLNICTDVSPLNDDYLDAQAQAMFDAGEKEQLQAILARAASERGRVTDYLRQGRYAVKLGNLDEAQQAFLTASKLDQGQSWKVQRELADFYGSVGDRPRQVRRLRMAYFLNPENEPLLAEIRRLGEVPGPSFGMAPEEFRITTVKPD